MGHTPTRRRRHPSRSNCQPGAGAAVAHLPGPRPQTVSHLPGPRCPSINRDRTGVRCREGCQMAATPPVADAPMAAAKPLTSPNTVGPVGIEPTTRGSKGDNRAKRRPRSEPRKRVRPGLTPPDCSCRFAVVFGVLRTGCGLVGLMPAASGWGWRPRWAPGRTVRSPRCPRRRWVSALWPPASRRRWQPSRHR